MSVLVGLDIGAAAVKVAVVRTAYRRVSLEALATVDIPRTRVAEAGAGGDEGSKDAALVEAVRGAIAGALLGKPFDAVAVAVDGDRVAVHVVELPASAAKSVGEVLPFELEAALPVEMSESVFDYRSLGTRDDAREDGAESMLRVLTVVGRTDLVRARIDAVNGALGVEPERVGVGAFALASLIPHLPVLGGDDVKVLLDLGLDGSDVLLVSGGEAVFARTLSLGTHGLPATAGKLARELRVTFAAYRAEGGAAPTRVYLCGGGAFVSGAEAFLARELEVPVEVLPVPNLEMPTLTAPVAALGPVATGTPEAAPAPLPAIGDKIAQLPKYAKAVGLALSLTGRPPSFDLRRGPLAYERGFAWIKEKVPVLAGLAAVIVVSFFFSMWAQLYGVGVDHDRFQDALADVTKDVLGEETSSATRANELLANQTAVTDEDPMPHADAFDVMVKLSADVSPSMTHDIEELDIQKGHVVVHGVVGTIPEAQSIATALGNERCFSDVHVTRTNQAVGSDRQKYVLEFDIKCPEDVRGAKKPAAGAGASGTPGGGAK